MQNEFTIKSVPHTFRIKEMNAIELFALQTQLQFDSTEQSEAVFKTLLERIEVQCDKTWLPVKAKGQEVYYPAGIEYDIKAVKELIGYFMNEYLKPVFQNSDVLSS